MFFILFLYTNQFRVREERSNCRMGLTKSHHLTILSLAILSLASATVTSFTTLPDEFSILDRTRGLDDTLSGERANKVFQRWKEEHRKAYRDSREEEERFRKFKDNLRYVMEKNAYTKRSGKGHVVGLNRFADMSKEEFREVYLSKVSKPVNKKWGESVNRKRKVDSCESPSSLDWRDDGIVTGVKDQGECGSCWAFSSTGAMEGINALVTGDLISLSEQELVACDTTNDGCDGGYMDYAFAWVVSNGGIDSEANYPYTSGNGVSGTCNTTKEEQKVVTIDGYVDVGETDSALLCAVVKQPISVGMDGSAIDFQLYTGGIYDGSCSSDPNDIDHAVLIVGFGSKNGVDYWICKNSWGTSWGIEGYFYIERNTSLEYGVCAINAMASYPTKESSPSPASPPSPSPPPPPPSSPPPPPPPPPPSTSDCGDYSYCPTDETCCCLYEYNDFCLTYGCCSYENAVCCTGSNYCCPSDYPICDVQEGLCFQSAEDNLGVAAENRKLAKRTLPWTKLRDEKEMRHQPLQWKRSRSTSIR